MAFGKKPELKIGVIKPDRLKRALSGGGDVARAAVEAKNKRTKRDLVFRAGVLSLPNGEKVQVVLKNVSPTGARIEFMQKIDLPAEVRLSAPTLNLNGMVHIAWQEEGAAGIKFGPAVKA
jgi:hypothetical protein